MSESAAFFKDSIEAYGQDGARELSLTIMNSLNESQQRLPLVRPIKGFRLLISEAAETWTGSTAESEESIRLAFSPKVGIRRLLANVPSVIEHEVAHVAHAQRNPEIIIKGWDDWDKSVWSGMLKEGVAMHAEFSLNDGYDPLLAVPITRSKRRKIDKAIADALYGSLEPSDSAYCEYMYDDPTFPMRAYATGHFVIGSFVAETGADMLQLMNTPLAEFREFAETQL